MRPHVLSHVAGEPQRSDVSGVRPLGEVDGIAEAWCDDQAATDAAFASPGGRRRLAQGSTSIGRQKTFIVREQVVIG